MTTRPAMWPVVAVLLLCGGYDRAAASVPMAASATAAAALPQRFAVPGAGTVTAYVPAGAPAEVVLFLSGSTGWTLTEAALAEQLTAQGALVVGIDLRAFRHSLDAGRSCAYPTGNVEEISRFVQQRLGLAAYKRPIVAGYGAGAAMAYAVVAAAPNDTLAGAISVAFCPDLDVHASLCHMRGLKATRRPAGRGYLLQPYPESSIPWMVLADAHNQACAPAASERFVRATGASRLFALPPDHGATAPAQWDAAYLDAYHAVATANATHDVPRVTAPAVADLSLVEVPAAGSGHDDTMAVVLSGDGGWAELDQAVARGFAAQGVPVVGWSSLDYYWTPRTAAEAAAALTRIIARYTVTWHRPKVIVVGYSFGADVAPFLVNRLPADARSHVATLALLAPSDTAAFEFHVAGWLGLTTGATFATRPEIGKLAVPTTCISPEDDPAPSCAAGNVLVRAVTAPAGHHFGGDYDRLVHLIMQ